MISKRPKTYRIVVGWGTEYDSGQFTKAPEKAKDAHRALGYYMDNSDKRGHTYRIVKLWTTGQDTEVGYIVSYYRVELVDIVSQEHIKLYYHAKYMRKA
jgi:hypothetical protein